MQTKSVTIRPRNGGNLATEVGLDTAGLADYSRKLNFRRGIDDEIRREGHDYFWPNTLNDGDKTFATDPGDQPFPGRATLIRADRVTFNHSTLEGEIVFPSKHVFVVGETIRVQLDGTDNWNINGVWMVTDVMESAPDCRTKLKINITGWSGTSTVSITGGDVGSVWSEEPVTLIHEATRPNGQKALVVGTRPRLYRFLSLEETGYYAGEYIEDADADFPYVDDNPGEWIVIGTGFSMNAQRWEAVSINGWSIFNNGVDLPHSYRVEDFEALPLHELRENGVASVGTIAEFGGVLFLGNVAEIQAEALDSLFVPGLVEYPRGAVASIKELNGVVTLDNSCGFTFTADDVGKVIEFSDGQTATIVAFLTSESVLVDVNPLPPFYFTINRLGFKLYQTAAQTGLTSSNGITVTGTSGSPTLTASANIFTVGMVGNTVRLLNGAKFEIATYISPTQVTLTENLPYTISSPGWLFAIIDPTADDIVTSTFDLFDECSVGRFLMWPETGHVRRITEFIDANNVRTNSFEPVPSGPVVMRRDDTYGAFTDESAINRVLWRVMWSDFDAPTRFYPSVFCSVSKGSRRIRLLVPARSFYRGQQVLVIGAGENGGNLTTTIVSISADGLSIRVSDEAKSTLHGALIQDSAGPGSMVGYEDIQDDSSGILKMLELQGTMVIYKDTSIFLVNPTGDATAPYIFRRRVIPKSHSLYFRNTLVLVDDDYHLYAGKDNFFAFRLTTLRPDEHEVMELCKGLFFQGADLANTEYVWAASNALTKEVWFSTPNTGEFKSLCFDYLYNRASTTDADISAAKSVKRPKAGLAVRETEDWFVMGNSTGVVLVYGKTVEPVPSFGNLEEIHFRREAYPFATDKSGYESILRSGMGDFGNPYHQKALRAIAVHLSSRSEEHELQLMPLSANLLTNGVTLILADHHAMSNPATRNRLNVYARGQYFGDEIKVEGMDNPVRISGRTYEYTALKTGSMNLTDNVS